MFDLGCADGEAGDDRGDREHSSTPSADTQTGHSRGARSVARKCHSSSQTTSNR